MKKETHFQIKGISQDMAYQLFNPQYAFEMKNIRINTTDANSLLSLTNEKGTFDNGGVIIKDGQKMPLKVLGYGQFSDYAVLFSKAMIEFRTVYSDDITLTLPSDSDGNRIKTVEERADTVVTIPATTVKVIEDNSLVDVTPSTIGNTPPVIFYPSEMMTVSRLFSSFNGYPDAITISKYYAAFKFTALVIERLEGLARATTMMIGMKKNWTISWPNPDGTITRIAGSNEDSALQGNLLDKYLVYNYVTETWCFTDSLEAITVETTPNPSKDVHLDCISVVKNDGTTRLLYEGDLNFQSDKVIHTVCLYENEDVQKIYWTDGVNVPRVANVAPNTWDDVDKNLSFQKIDFLPRLNYGEKITITKSSGGKFPAGIVQYAFSYSDKNLQETNLFYVSPLYYAAQSSKGAAADETCNIAFDITIENADTRFDYIQVYVLIRTSLNATPAAYTISNIPCRKSGSENGTIKLTDNGFSWEAYTPTDVLYKQLSSFVPNIITSKDSTLFLGNYQIESPYVKESDIQSFINNLRSNLHFDYMDFNTGGSDYAYDLLNGGRAIKTFRSRQPYRIGVQFQDERGTPTNILYLDDITPRSVPEDGIDSPSFKQKIINATFNKSLLSDSRLKRVRLVMVDRTNMPKNTICQGVLCPTIYRINDRVNNQPFAMSSWNMRGFNTSSLKDAQNGFPAESDAQWMTDMPLMPNLVKRGGEIANQSSSGMVGIRATKSGSDDFNSTITVNTSEVSKTYYYCAHAYVEYDITSGTEKFYFHTRLSRTTNPNVITSRQQREDDQKDYYDDWSFGLWQVYNAAMAKGYDVYTSQGLRQYAMGLYREKLESLEEYADVALQMLFDQWRLPNDFVERCRNFGQSTIAIYAFGYGARTDSLSYNVAKIQFNVTNNFDGAIQAASTRPYFFCDHNILTFHSPDIEANQQLIDNNRDIKYRIVGYTKIDKSYFNNYIKIDRGPANKSNNGGLQVSIKSSGLGIYNSTLWRDASLYPTYLWHRNLSLGSQDGPDDEGKIYGSYSRKIFSNVHFCNNSYAMILKYGGEQHVVNWFDPTDGNDSPFPTMGTPRVFNSNEVSALTVDGQANSPALHNKLIYYGNVSMAHVGSSSLVPIQNESGTYEESSIENSDSTLIQYKSTPHVVMPMNFKTISGVNYAPSLPIPYCAEQATAVSDWVDFNSGTQKSGYLWSTQLHGYYRSSCGFSMDGHVDPTGLLYIAELYQDLNATQIYGDTSEDNLSKLTWIPISDWVKIEDGSELVGYGDTFIGRWDCLKTYSFTEEDQQSCVDITSFIVESDINLQSRTDPYKGVRDGTVLNPQNFNLFNPVYDQVDNFFMYHYLRESEALNNFQNQVCWSQPKTLGEELDKWAQINVGNNTDFQGEYGQLRAGFNFNNQLYFLQENAIYKVNYNTRVAISPSDGVPIQISNNYNVDPPLLLKQFTGTDSQEKIVVSPNMAYFYDPLRARINALTSDDKVSELSTEKGVNSLLANHRGVSRCFYDSLTKDTLFQFGDGTDALAFNEDIMEFISLYSYDSLTSLFSLDSHTFVTKGSNLWSLREGNYNYFFGSDSTAYKPFYIDMLLNQDPLQSKMFTNVDYTMVGDNDRDMANAKDEDGHLKPFDSFDTLDVHTSYQENQVNLAALRFKPSNLKRKFRTWAIDLPRDRGSRDRLCDMWLRMKLSKVGENNNKYRINNINATYYTI